MSKKTVYTIQRIHWDYTDEYYEPYVFDEAEVADVDSFVSLVTFDSAINFFMTHEETETQRRVLERAERKRWDYHLNDYVRNTYKLDHIDFPITFHNYYNGLEGDMCLSFCSLSWKEFQEQIHPFNLPPPEPVEPQDVKYWAHTEGM
jgi:hypothetical protein